MKVSIVTPCYNESEVIERYYQEVKAVLDGLTGWDHEIIFVDDGSTDGTRDKLKGVAGADGKVCVVTLSRNFGHQIALSGGIDRADGDVLVMMDSDLQHRPELIREMIAKWQQGYDIVSAVREKTEAASWYKSFTSKFFYYVFNKLSDTYLEPGAADFCLLSRRVYSQLRGMKERHRFLRGLISWMGFERCFIPYRAPQRAGGKSKYSWTKMLAMAIEATLSFSSLPLRMATRVGMLVTLGGFGYMLWILEQYFVQREQNVGWPSLICSVLILGGFQLMFIGLIGQYLARVFEEVKGRPLYIVKEISGDNAK
jgi:dolichol-phosphate mannosyltransferase